MTLQPGQTLGGASGVTLSLSETGTTLVPANFTVTATAVGAPNVTLSTPGQLELQTESIVVATVATNPPFTQPGTPVDVTATLQVAVNEPRSLSAQYTVTDPTGKVVFTSTPVAVPVTAASSVVHGRPRVVSHHRPGRRPLRHRRDRDRYLGPAAAGRDRTGEPDHRTAGDVRASR